MLGSSVHTMSHLKWGGGDTPKLAELTITSGHRTISGCHMTGQITILSDKMSDTSQQLRC